MEGWRLRAGGPVLVPMTKHGAKAAKLAQVSPVRAVVAVAVPARSHASAARQHVVRGGDSLYAIARRYGATVDALAELNGLAAASVLHAGQKLNLP